MIQTACRVYPLLSLVLCSAVFVGMTRVFQWSLPDGVTLKLSLYFFSEESFAFSFCSSLSSACWAIYTDLSLETRWKRILLIKCVCLCVSLWLSSINFLRQPSEQNRTEAGPFADGLDPAGQLGHRSDRHRGPHRTRQPCGACQARSGGRRLDGNTGEGVQRDAIHELSSRR